MVQVTIDGQVADVKVGSTILEAAKTVGIKIPTLCHHPDQAVKANCRICVVEVEGQKLMQPSCSFPVWEGMVVKTNTPKVQRVRSNVLELILSHHAQDCLFCSRNGSCELQNVTQDMHFTRELRYSNEARAGKDTSSPSIVRDTNKCILCGRCSYMCNEVQTVGALCKEGRGFTTRLASAYGKDLGDSTCTNCGQCIQACPVGALTIHDDTQKVLEAIEGGKHVVAQVAPAVRITIAEALGESPGTVTKGRLVTAIKRVGFDKVFDTDFTADLTIMEEGHELLYRIRNGGVLPMVTSCCPAWIKFCETSFADELKHLSSCKSPQQMFGALLKTYYPETSGVYPKDIYSVSIMPCTAKKFEAIRPEMNSSGYQDIDTVITVQELANMIRAAGIHFTDLPETEFDSPFGLGTGAGEIFGATGGVMEAALRTVYELVTEKELSNLDFEAVRGFDGIKDATVDLDGLSVKVAIAHGLGNARKLMDAVKAGEADYHFIEVMACPGGCIGGGGNPIKDWKKMERRLEGVYAEDVNLPLRKSHKNPYVQKLYSDFLGAPLGSQSHRLLHTRYTDRSHVLKP